MIDIYAVAVIVTLIAGLATMFILLKGEIRELRSEIAKVEDRQQAALTEMEARLKSDMIEMEARLKSDMIELEARLKSDMTEMNAGLKSDMTEMKADIKTTDDRLRSIDRNVARIGGFLEGRIPDFIQDPDSETTAQEEQVGEAVAGLIPRQYLSPLFRQRNDGCAVGW